MKLILIFQDEDKVLFINKISEKNMIKKLQSVFFFLGWSVYHTKIQYESEFTQERFDCTFQDAIWNI